MDIDSPHRPSETINMAPVRGLTSFEAAKRLADSGPNEPVHRGTGGVAREFVRLSSNPLVLILLIAAITSSFLGQAANATIIGTIVLLSIALDFILTHRSQNAVRRLQERVAPGALAFRDQTWRRILRRELVPGDLVQVSAGDLVPADARILDSIGLYVQEAALTGESTPIRKEVSREGAPNARDVIFLGTTVVSGSATAEVVATGSATTFGHIAQRLAATPEPTEFDHGLRDFSFMLARTVLFLVIFLIGSSIVLHRITLNSLLFAVALAVGLTPEFLPMITTVTLSKGAVAMARKKVIVKHLSRHPESRQRRCTLQRQDWNIDVRPHGSE